MTFTWQTATHYFRTTLRLMTTYNILSLVTKDSVVQKISSRQTLIEILNHCCDLDLEQSNPVFAQNILTYDDVPMN